MSKTPALGWDAKMSCCCCRCPIRLVRMIMASLLLMGLVAAFLWLVPVLKILLWNYKHFTPTGLQSIERHSLQIAEAYSIDEGKKATILNILKEEERNSGIHLITAVGLEDFMNKLKRILQVFYDYEVWMGENKSPYSTLVSEEAKKTIKDFHRQVLQRPRFFPRSIHQTYKSSSDLPKHWLPSRRGWMAYQEEQTFNFFMTPAYQEGLLTFGISKLLL